MTLTRLFPALHLTAGGRDRGQSVGARGVGIGRVHSITGIGLTVAVLVISPGQAAPAELAGVAAVEEPP